MMKKTVLGLASCMLLSAVGHAAPLSDYSEGKVAVDLAIKPSNHVYATSALGSDGFNGSSAFNYGLTVGVGNNFALQYNNNNAKSKDYISSTFGPSANGKIDAQEINVLYNAGKNVNIFAGITQVKSIYTVNGSSIYAGTYSGENSNNWQIGVSGQTLLGDNITGYATVAAGKDTNSYKVGVSYAFNNNVDFNLFYSQNKYNNVKFNSSMTTLGIGSTGDYTIKGIGYGLTYKL